MNKKFSEITGEVRRATVHLAICEVKNGPDGKYANTRSMGTGFFISDDGWLLTSLHVVQSLITGKDKIVAAFKADDNNVTFSEATQIDHKFPEIDLCAIKFNTFPQGASKINLSETLPEQGENIGLFGYPDSWLSDFPRVYHPISLIVYQPRSS